MALPIPRTTADPQARLGCALAIAAAHKAQQDAEKALKAMLQPRTVIYWYVERHGNWHRQEGEVICANGSLHSLCVHALNTRTHKEVWLTAYDLRFWLWQTTPEAVASPHFRECPDHKEVANA